MNENDSFFEELSRDVDADHRRIQGADGPPAHMWQTIRAQANPERTKEENVMNSTRTIEHSPVFAPRVDTRPQNGVRHTLSLAASFLVVVSVALGGWFATMQLNSPNGSNGAFGLLGQSNGEATCDVEPLSVDRVMEIVENPIPFMANGPTGEPTEPENPENALFTESRHARWSETTLFSTGTNGAPSDEEFDQSGVVADAYMTCLVAGTMGQIWTFYSAATIQEIVLTRLSVFASEEDVRAYVSERISAPANEDLSHEKYFRDAVVNTNATEIMINPDRQLALQHSGWGRYESIIIFGVRMNDSDGQPIYLTNGTGYELIQHPSRSTKNLAVTVAVDRNSGQLVVFPNAPISFGN